MMFPKPKDTKKRSSGVKTKKDGREVCDTDYQWRLRRWELFVLINADESKYGDVGNGGVCFVCGCKLEFGAAEPFGSGGCGETNYHAHHSRGTRGLGGGFRDDRIFVPFDGDIDEAMKVIWKEYPFMPKPPEGMMWNLYALCNECHLDKEHNQGFHGELQWSGGMNGKSASN